MLCSLDIEVQRCLWPSRVWSRAESTFRPHCVFLEGLTSSAKTLHIMAVNEDTNCLPFTCAAHAFHSAILISHGKGTVLVGGHGQLQGGDF